MSQHTVVKGNMADSLVLVTGGSGFVASHVTKQLQEAGHRVRVTVRDPKNEKKVKPLRDLCPTAQYPLEIVQADLLNAESWAKAVEGCSYVMHIASPFPVHNPKTSDEIVKPAVEGTLNVLKACSETNTVKRVVLTSSCFTIGVANVKESNMFSEDDFLKEEDSQGSVYAKSKILAERAAWTFVEGLAENKRFELAVVNPGFVLGPVFHGTPGTSMDLIRQLMQREMPVIVKVAIFMVDVRDVATAHIKCMTLPEAAGRRHLVGCGTYWLKELAEILDREFKSQGYNVPTKVAPGPLTMLIKLFNQQVKQSMTLNGEKVEFDLRRMKEVLLIDPTPAEKSITDMAYSMIENGHVKKTAKYRGPSGSAM